MFCCVINDFTLLADPSRTIILPSPSAGYNSKSEIVNYSHFNPSWSDIVQEASRVVTFIDLAGHEKYLKTTVFGMTANLPDYAMLVVGANMGITRMTKEHIGLCLALKLPFFVLITKVGLSLRCQCIVVPVVPLSFLVENGISLCKEITVHVSLLFSCLPTG